MPEHRRLESAEENAPGPYIHVQSRDDLPHDSRPCLACFAYQLHRIGTPRDEEEQNEATQSALTWHRQLLSLVALAPPEARLHLRYLSTPRSRGEKASIVVALIAVVEGVTAVSALEEAIRLRSDLSIVLHSQASAGARVYQFLSVADKDALRRLLVPFRPRMHLHIVRRTARGRFSDAVAVGPATNCELESGVILPVTLPDESISTLHQTCRLLLEQESMTLLDLVLRPTHITRHETNLLRGIAERAFQDERSTQELAVLRARSEDLLREGGRCFLLEIHVARDSEEMPRTLRAAITTDFFDHVSKADLAPAAIDIACGMLHLRALRRPEEGRLACLYTLSEAMRAFRLPLPVEGSSAGIPSTHPVYEYIPARMSTEGPILGAKDFGQRLHFVRVHPSDLRRHVYILGQTGTGKTSLLRSMIRERLKAGTGVGVIDPHGDLFESVREDAVRMRGDLVVFDPTDEESAVRLNLLEYDAARPRDKSTLINELFHIFEQEYNMREAGGPIFETYMRNALLLVMDNANDPGTLVDTVRVFQDREFRETLLNACRNQSVVDFWRKVAEAAGGDSSLQNMTPYVTSKLNRFVYDQYLLPLVEERRSTIDFRRILDEGKVLLIKLPKGRLTEFGVRMFGTVLLTRILLAALSREEIPEASRRDFVLFVDEFQSFTSPAAASMLSEARKYRLNLVLANQALGQLRSEILDAILGNVGSLVFLRPGIGDYDRIGPYVSPPFRREEILNLPNFAAVARLMIDNRPSLPFLFTTLRDSDGM